MQFASGERTARQYIITLNKLIADDIVSRGSDTLCLERKTVRRIYRGLVVNSMLN